MLERTFRTNMNRIEIEIITDCNIRCINCNRSCRQAPSNEFMSLAQIAKFIQESLDLSWRWGKISLLGGEPTLHPDLFDILTVVKEYHNIHPDCEIQLVTNGFGDKVKKRIVNLPLWVYIENTRKKSAINKFSSYNMAPLDLDEFRNADFTSACFITTHCGMGLTRYGFYPCGPGASLDRVFGFDMGIKRLADVSASRLEEQLAILCSYCGHFKDFDPYRLDFTANWATHEMISTSWQRAYHEYQMNRPSLMLY